MNLKTESSVIKWPALKVNILYNILALISVIIHNSETRFRVWIINKITPSTHP